jgi:hypothetical protein
MDASLSRRSRIGVIVAGCVMAVAAAGPAQAAWTASEYPIPTTGANPWGIATGPDGGIWFTEDNGNKVARIDPDDGTITEYPLVGGSGPLGITAGPGGSVWFTEGAGDQIGKLTFVAPPPPPAGAVGGSCNPTVTGIIPDTGTVGSEVTIIGTQLGCARGVLFGGSPALAYTVDDDQHITARAPDHEPGQVAVQVVAGSSISPIVLAGRFTYAAVAPPVTAVSPAARVLRCARVPTLTGFTVAQARRILARDHCVTTLHVKRTASRHHGRQPKIQRQSTRPGTPLYAGDRGIEVTLARRPPSRPG